MELNWDTWLHNNYPGRRKLLLWLTACAKRFKTRLELPEVFETLDATMLLLDQEFPEGELLKEVTKQRNKLALAERLIRNRSGVFMPRDQQLRVLSVFRELTLLVQRPRRPLLTSVERLRGQMVNIVCALPPWAMRESVREREQEEQFELYKCVSQDLKFEPSWLRWNNECVIRLAEAIYRTNRFKELPVIADALEEAGCHDPEILSHCRQPRNHYRGCWVVDGILGK